MVFETGWIGGLTGSQTDLTERVFSWKFPIESFQVESQKFVASVNERIDSTAYKQI